jgi:hypothetical protein
MSITSLKAGSCGGSLRQCHSLSDSAYSFNDLVYSFSKSDGSR